MDSLLITETVKHAIKHMYAKLIARKHQAAMPLLIADGLHNDQQAIIAGLLKLVQNILTALGWYEARENPKDSLVLGEYASPSVSVFIIGNQLSVIFSMAFSMPLSTSLYFQRVCYDGNIAPIHWLIPVFWEVFRWNSYSTLTAYGCSAFRESSWVI